MLDGEVTLTCFRHGGVGAGPGRGGGAGPWSQDGSQWLGQPEMKPGHWHLLVSLRRRDLCTKLSFASLSKSRSNPRFLDFISILTKSFPVLGRAKEDEVYTLPLTPVWDS